MESPDKTAAATTWAPIPPTETKIVYRDPKISDAMLAAFSAFGFALSARALVLLSLLGAFVLALMAMRAQTNMSAILLTLYCVLTVIPLVVLELRSK